MVQNKLFHIIKAFFKKKNKTEYSSGKKESEMYPQITASVSQECVYF